MHESAQRLLTAAQGSQRGKQKSIKTFADVIKDMGESPQTSINWQGERGVSSGGAMKAERLYGCSPTWILEGGGKPLSVGAPIAHSTSLKDLTVELQLLDWGDKMDSARDHFRAVMPDDAMHPEAEQGWEIVFRPATSAKPGQGVLVRDKDGNRFFRMFHEGGDDGWEAHPIRKTYRALKQRRDGLVIIAVMDHIKKPKLG